MESVAVCQSVLLLVKNKLLIVWIRFQKNCY